MGTLAKLDPVKFNDRGGTTSLPPWLSGSLEAVQVMGGVPTIPENRALSAEQRSTAQSLVEAIDRRLTATSDRATGEEVAKLLLAFLVQDVGKGAMAALSDAYAVALEDVPAWAVRRARERWLQNDLAGTGLEDANIAFRPNPPQFRKLCNAVLVPLRAQRYAITRLLSARVEVEHSPEHRAAMLRRIAGALSPMGLSPDDFAERDKA